jgi:tetratricopeptide (TPR) repeat protein
VKLIDLGAVRRIGDPDGGVFFKWGYMAPEGIYDPYEPSDLFTVGRTLAFLVTDMNTRQTGPMRKAIPAEPFASRGVKVEDAKRWTAKLKDGSGLPAWLKFDAAAMSLSGQAPPGVLQITVAVTALGADGKPLADRHGDAATIPFDIVLPLALPEPQEIHFDVPLPRFARESLDVKGQLSWTVALADGSALPAWLKWDAKKTAFSGWAPDGVGSVGVMVTAADGAGKKASVPFTIRLPFVESESLYRLLLKATAYDANARFQTAEEMLSQLTGVLRELVAQRGPIPSADDPEFLRERAVPGLDPALTDGMWRRLPDLRIDEADTARSEVFAAAGTSDPEERVKLLSAIAKQKPDSGEARLRCAGLMIEGGSPAEDRIMRLLDQAAAIDQWDWRPDWYCGLMRLALGQGAEAVESFDRVYGEVPGSAAPKLALAMALEMAGRRDEAAGLYDRVSRADPAMPAASFGLARCRAASGDRAGAVDAYSRVPSGSAVYSDAQLAAALTLVESSHLGSPSADDLMSASGILTALPREDIPRHVAEVALLLEAVALIEGSPKAAKDVRLLGVPMRQRDLRLRAEQALKACGRLAKTAAERIAYVDLANSVRPRTTW